VRDDEVRDLVIDGAAEEYDALVEQARVDVERALAAGALLDDHRDQWHLGYPFDNWSVVKDDSNQVVVNGGR